MDITTDEINKISIFLGPDNWDIDYFVNYYPVKHIERTKK